MACLHKFEKYLNLERLDFKPTTLIVGTFNPSWPESNPAQWFYGRTANNYFWEVLPRIYGEESMINEDPSTWKAFCKRYNIALTDFIAVIEDADYSNKEHHELLKNYSDSNIARKFESHMQINILALLASHSTIKTVFFTRGAKEAFWKKCWKPIELYCQNNGLKTCTLLTPSGYAYFQQGRYNRLHPESRLSLPDFIHMKWKEVWHFV